jgi:hypothetical protein
MNYWETAGDLWRHHDLGDAAHDAVSLVQYATLAASSHNTQPWKFKCGPGHIVILPDLSRRCPRVDPDDHHLYASLGCATENLILAARAAGFSGNVRHDPPGTTVHVDFEKATPLRSALFEAIPNRQCSRTEYDGTRLSNEQLGLLAAAGSGSQVSVMLLTDPKQMDQVADYVAAGNTAQFGDAGWSTEMKKWIRFDADEATRSADGLYGPVMGFPSVPRWLGEIVTRVAASARRQNHKDLVHIRSSAAIAVIVSEVDDPRHWIEAGRCYERLALQAAALDLRTAFINQPVEVPGVRSQFASFLGIGGRRPDLVVRIGRGPMAPRSLRRPVKQVLC